MKQKYIAYTDGSCLNKEHSKPGGYACIVMTPGGRIVKKVKGGELHTTNNRMELLAIINAIKCVPAYSFVHIYTDSEYCIKALLSKKPVKNLDLIKRYKDLKDFKELTVYLQWVRGHDGNTYNEECDKLAAKECKKMLAEAKNPKPVKKYTWDRETYGSQVTNKRSRGW